MKFVNAPISVDVHKGVPRRIRWGRHVYRVRRLLDYWILQSRWWGREVKRVYFRLETDGGVMEVYREEGGVRSEEGERRREKGRAVAHPPFVEGDTHTRELRETESPYRPDAADLAGRRRMRNSTAKTPEKAPHTRWVLSKMVD